MILVVKREPIDNKYFMIEKVLGALNWTESTPVAKVGLLQYVVRGYNIYATKVVLQNLFC